MKAALLVVLLLAILRGAFAAPETQTKDQKTAPETQTKDQKTAPENKKCFSGSFLDAKKSKCRKCPAGTYSDVAGAKQCKPCDLNFSLARASGRRKCERCTDSATTNGPKHCFNKQKLTCVEDEGGDICKSTTDNDLKTSGTIPEEAAVRYYLSKPASLASLTFWRSLDCCAKDVENLKITFPDRSYCTITPEKVAPTSTREYVRMTYCGSDNVEFFDVSSWGTNGSISFTEIQFDSW